MAKRFATRVALATAGAILALPAAADTPGVGRLTYQAAHVTGAPLCTGTLIAPDLVLTAGHCLNEHIAKFPQSARFSPGHGSALAGPQRQGAQVIRPAPRQMGPTGLDNDIALLRLDRPFGPEEATPVSIATGVQTGPFLLLGYDRLWPDVAPLGEACRALALLPVASPQVVGLDCAVVSGNSGGPLLVRGPDGTWQLAAVMVARGGRSLPSLAVIPPEGLVTPP